VSPDGDIFATGVCTATSFSGDGSNLTGLSGVSVANQADNRLITATGTTDALNGESTLTFDGGLLKLQVDSGEFRVEAANGVDAFSVDSDNGNTVIGGSGTLTIPDTIVHAGDTDTKIRFPSADTITAETGGSERLRITSNGDVGIGYDSPTVKLHIREAASGFSGTYDNRYHCILEDDAEAYVGFYLPDNGYGGLRFNDTTGLEGYIDYYFNTDELHYSSSGSHRFFAAGTERIRVHSGGTVNIPSGITLGEAVTSTASSNTLDDYEEGTWTPDWHGASALGTITYGSYNAASYVKIGNQVTVRGYSELNGASGASGVWFIDNLPFTVGGGDDRRYRSVGSVMLENFDLQDSEESLVCYVERNNNDLQIRGTRDNMGASTNIKAQQDDNFEVYFTITYPTA
jgi:hypothetical protein